MRGWRRSAHLRAARGLIGRQVLHSAAMPDHAAFVTALILAPRLTARSAALHDELATVIARSRALLSLGHERRLSSVYPRLRLIRGGSDAGLVAVMIADAKLCLHCIATTTGLPLDQVDASLVTITRTLRLRIGPHRCDSCRQHKTTFSVTKDGHP
jgi:hypothetical protein